MLASAATISSFTSGPQTVWLCASAGDGSDTSSVLPIVTSMVMARDRRLDRR